MTVQDTLYSYDDLAFDSVTTGNVSWRRFDSSSDYATTSYTYDVYGNALTQQIH